MFPKNSIILVPVQISTDPLIDMKQERNGGLDSPFGMANILDLVLGESNATLRQMVLISYDYLSPKSLSSQVIKVLPTVAKLSGETFSSVSEIVCQ